MRLAWKQLNDTISASSLADRKTLAYILKKRRKTAWRTLLLADKTSFLFSLLFAIALSGILLSENNGFLLLNIQAIGLLLIVAMLNYFSYRKLTKMKLDESVLVLHKQVTSYKRMMVWEYFISYLLVAIFIISLFLIFPLSHTVKISIVLIIPVGVAVDYFIFHWSANHVSTLIETSKELDELNAEADNPPPSNSTR